MTEKCAPEHPPRVEVEQHDLHSVFERIERHAHRRPRAPALLAEDSQALDYAALFELVKTATVTLRNIGIHNQDRVAVVLPAGPELAAAIITIASGAVCVPLNPNLADADWHQYYSDLRVDALLTIPGTNAAAEDAAGTLGLQIIELIPAPGIGAGVFDLRGNSANSCAGEDLPQLEDDAIVLPTSGTTAQPKGVPLTHRNLCHSAANTAKSLHLSHDDTLLSVLPFHHAHGLISGLMSALFIGSSVAVLRQFSAQSFYKHLSDFKPTWYTAVPAIHQAITAEASHQRSALENHSLRLIRSASASLPNSELEALEHAFGVPVIETYGMTEAASQIASNPLPPKARKPGSVGMAAGPEITILDSAGRQLTSGQEGEIALRGPNMTRGYDPRSTDSIDAIENGWFRTGDIGYLDDEGYLYLVGRTKEQINRGGEKISPQKVEQVLLEHPDVKEAVAFALPHPRLGEDVGAAVVLQHNAPSSALDIRSFAFKSHQLRHAEIPRHVVLRNEIPRSPLGKIQRIGMADTLGLKDKLLPQEGPQSSFVAPSTGVEQSLAGVWTEVFGLSRVGARDDFFLLGGDSLLAVQMAMRVSEVFDVTLSLRTIFEAPTISELAQQIDEQRVLVEESYNLEAARSEIKVEKPVSIAQENILNLEGSFKGLPLFNVPLVFHLVGAFNPRAFERGLKQLISRHEIFRIVFKDIRGEWKTSPTAAINTRISVEDWKIVPDTNHLEFIDSVAANEARAFFDLSKSPPFRVRLVKFGDHNHFLIFTLHHIIMDGWTTKIILEELFQHYSSALRGETASLPKPELQFSDFAHWQRQWCKGPTARRQLDFWAAKLQDAGSLFADRQDLTQASLGVATARANVHLSNELVARISDLSRRENCTVFIALLTGLKVLLSHQFAQEDVCIATPMANRTRPNTEGLPGLIENTAVVRTQFSDEISFSEALMRVRESVLDAHAHQEFPYELLVHELGKEYPAKVYPFSDVYFSVTSRFDPKIDLEDLQVTRIENVHNDSDTAIPISGAKFTFMLKETSFGIEGSCAFKENQFKPEQVHELISAYEDLLSLVTSRPEERLGQLRAKTLPARFANPK